MDFHKPPRLISLRNSLAFSGINLSDITLISATVASLPFSQLLDLTNDLQQNPVTQYITAKSFSFGSMVKCRSPYSDSALLVISNICFARFSSLAAQSKDKNISIAKVFVTFDCFPAIVSSIYSNLLNSIGGYGQIFLR